MLKQSLMKETHKNEVSLEDYFEEHIQNSPESQKKELYSDQMKEKVYFQSNQQKQQFELIYASIAHSIKSKKLKVSFQNIEVSSIFSHFFSIILVSPSNLSNLSLNLENSQLNDSHALEISESLKKLHLLRSIDLNFKCNRITDEGITRILSPIINDMNQLDSIALNIDSNPIFHSAFKILTILNKWNHESSLKCLKLSVKGIEFQSQITPVLVTFRSAEVFSRIEIFHLTLGDSNQGMFDKQFGDPNIMHRKENVQTTRQSIKSGQSKLSSLPENIKDISALLKLMLKHTVNLKEFSLKCGDGVEFTGPIWLEFGELLKSSKRRENRILEKFQVRIEKTRNCVEFDYFLFRLAEINSIRSLSLQLPGFINTQTSGNLGVINFSRFLGSRQYPPKNFRDSRDTLEYPLIEELSLSFAESGRGINTKFYPTDPTFELLVVDSNKLINRIASSLLVLSLDFSKRNMKDFSPESIRKSLLECYRLNELNLDFHSCTNISDEMILGISKWFSNLAICALRLDFRKTNLSDSGINIVLESLGSLRLTLVSLEIQFDTQYRTGDIKKQQDFPIKMIDNALIKWIPALNQLVKCEISFARESEQYQRIENLFKEQAFKRNKLVNQCKIVGQIQNVLRKEIIQEIFSFY